MSWEDASKSHTKFEWCLKNAHGPCSMHRLGRAKTEFIQTCSSVHFGLVADDAFGRLSVPDKDSLTSVKIIRNVRRFSHFCFFILSRISLYPFFSASKPSSLGTYSTVVFSCYLNDSLNLLYFQTKRAD